LPRLFYLPLVQPGVLLSLKAAKIKRLENLFPGVWFRIIKRRVTITFIE
jgi:hypothetical protein